jgi:hypothetical protein
MLKSFSVRALEIHDTHMMWNPTKMKRVFDFMVRNDMNTLVFHENNIVDKVVYPAYLFGWEKDDVRSYSAYTKLYKEIYYRTPSPYVFLDELLIFRDLLKVIAEQATSLGIDLYLQTKELWFPDILFESNLMKNGKICPSEPYWWETFLPRKYHELLVNFPEIAGIVTSTGTRESRASLAHGKCQCEQCRSMDLAEWQRNIVMAMYKPLKEAGKKLVVRDFTYYAREQNGLRSGLLDLPEDIIISIKNVPQDYYPTFPHNPLIGNTGKHEQWIEYEVMGEYFGWGVNPCIVLDDIKYRMKYCLDKGASGFTARIDWEALPNHSCFETQNLLNLYGIAHLAMNPDLPVKDIYYRWLQEEGLLAEGLDPQKLNRTIEWVMEIFQRTWPAMSKAPYMNGFLFCNNSKIPVSIENGDFLSREHHGIQKWFPEKVSLFDQNDKNVAHMLEERDQGVQEVNELLCQWSKENPGLKASVHAEIQQLFGYFTVYMRMYALVGKAYIYVKYLQEHGKKATLEPFTRIMEHLGSLVEQMVALEEEIMKMPTPILAYPTRCIISSERLRVFREDVQRIMPQLGV